ncbi:glycosyltransferase family 4 protein [Rasiella rasia]|uniref:Glycosyltransferase family 4 protein n=1 Tax=Rasiella rasia TaxID=2744027 RepID=A0A6G6GIC1_9FLAO|nr:glycosyltransferase family 4 protein [Rasiella rasia]QIE58267.1 glycosyltransferase family 4 protein [Rasiella rasia]
MENQPTLDIVMLSTFNRDAGGRETWLYNFLPELAKLKYFNTIRLFGFKRPDQENFTEAIQQLDPKIEGRQQIFPILLEKEKSKLPTVFAMFKEFKKFVRLSNHVPNHVMAMGILELWMVLKLKRYNNVKKIVWLRSIFSHEKAYRIPKPIRSLFLKYEISMLKKAHVVLGNGDDIKNFYASHGIKVKVVKNGVAMARWALPEIPLKDTIHIAYVGRLSQVKGIEDYLSLIEKVKTGSRAKQFTFHIVGNNDSYAEQVDSLVQKGYVVNHNMIPNNDLPKFMEKIDVCVALTYASETGGGGGTSNAMMEQMAAGRIILAWNNRIFDQYLNTDNAYLAEQYNVTELESQLLAIIHDKTLAKQKAYKALKTIEPYSYSLNVAKFLAALK